MNILVTNDDGIFAPGIKVMVKVLQYFGKVHVVCPDQERSAVSHTITLRQPLKADPVNWLGQHVEAWRVNGSPADCVKLGIEVLLKQKPDYVFSGINLGPNLGRDIYYSGTIAAAAEASLSGIPSVAVSLDSFYENTMLSRQTEELFYDVAEIIFQHRFPAGMYMNVNLPNVPRPFCRGVTVVPPDMSVSRYKYVGLNDPQGNVYHWLKDTLQEKVHWDEGGDYARLKEGHITVTPVDLKQGRRRSMQQVERWFKKDPLKTREDFSHG